MVTIYEGSQVDESIALPRTDPSADCMFLLRLLYFNASFKRTLSILSYFRIAHALPLAGFWVASYSISMPVVFR